MPQCSFFFHFHFSWAYWDFVKEEGHNRKIRRDTIVFFSWRTFLGWFGVNIFPLLLDLLYLHGGLISVDSGAEKLGASNLTEARSYYLIYRGWHFNVSASWAAHRVISQFFSTRQPLNSKHCCRRHLCLLALTFLVRLTPPASDTALRILALVACHSFCWPRWAAAAFRAVFGTYSPCHQRATFCLFFSHLPSPRSAFPFKSKKEHQNWQCTAPSQISRKSFSASSS